MSFSCLRTSVTGSKVYGMNFINCVKQSEPSDKPNTIIRTPALEAWLISISEWKSFRSYRSTTRSNDFASKSRIIRRRGLLLAT